LLAASLAGAAFVSPSYAAYPERPITIIVPFPAGGTTDLHGRLLGELLHKRTGATVIIENIAGAGAQLGIVKAAEARADGYTLLYANDPLLILPALRASFKLRTSDFIPLVRTRVAPVYLAVNPLVPAKDIKELIALAKSRPGELRAAAAGTGTVLHLAHAAFVEATGVKMIHVPYKGTAPSTIDTVAGHVEMVWTGAGDLVPFAQSNQLRPLAQTGAQRTRALPDVPTFAEMGFPDVSIISWNGMMAPKGTPPEIVKWLTEELAAIATSEEWYAKGEPLGIEPGAMLKGKDFADYLSMAETDTRRVIEKANIKEE
jgi:tripartite-type tricarboxylate transporter receptor subunit TctC